MRKGLQKTPQPLENIGVPTRTRTWDPLIKSQLLYHLSYGHILRPHRWHGPLLGLNTIGARSERHCMGRGQFGQHVRSEQSLQIWPVR